ncbi:hypothetical protein HELRODRAFT_74273, partial [Helobdella robusta]|uniref:tRNA-uridine aminocarboxypropyltransferase n=1 Tax=Helobdella robusta TaxID=6412 RepID=T1G1P2_HELRO
KESRCLQTAAMLFRTFHDDYCQLFQGKKFPPSRFQNLIEISKESNSILLYPSPQSVNIQEYIEDYYNDDLRAKNRNDNLSNYHNLFVLDGTWHHAKGIYFCNEFLHNMKQVKLNSIGVSKYTIRTQPTDDGLSTVESVALAVSILEDRPDVYEVLMKPLEALCRFQMEHGAVVHHSKEHLLKSGLKYPIKNKIAKNNTNVNNNNNNNNKDGDSSCMVNGVLGLTNNDRDDNVDDSSKS